LSRRQLRGLGVSEARIARWVRDGYLRKVLPHVYAVGNLAESVEADLVAAILYAGPGAMLSQATALWWHGLLAQQPSTTQISTPRKCRSMPGITVYARRKLELEHRRRLPTTTVSQALLDFAATAPVERVVRALAQADFQRVLDVATLRAFCGNGRPGSRTLKQAIRRHTPALAATKSELENAFHALCRRGGIPPYEVNRRVCGIEVDALWPELRVVVELDGVQGHATEAQMRGDRGRELELRLGGYVVLRYSYDQIVHEPQAVLADLRAALEDAAKRVARA
jgi:very-short-patch-repair endonuclease